MDAQQLPRARCAPLPLVRRGWGWGSRIAALTLQHAPPPSPALPHKGGGSRPPLPLVVRGLASSRRRLVRAAGLISLCALICAAFSFGSASAQDWPTRPV